MTESTFVQEREGEYTIDFEKLVEIFAKSLYPKEDMFIRELLQNAHDSIIKRQISDPMLAYEDTHKDGRDDGYEDDENNDGIHSVSDNCIDTDGTFFQTRNKPS